MCGCGKKKTQTEASLSTKSLRSAGASESEIIAEATDGEEFVYAIYNGAKYPHYLPSPTGIISSYGILNYGIGKKGDKVKIHRLDFEKANGRLYLPLPEGEAEMANNGNEGIRGPEPIDENVFIAEYENNKRINEQAEKVAKSEVRKAAKAAKEAEAKEEPKATAETTDVAEENKATTKKTKTTRTKKSEEKSEEPDNSTQDVNWNS